MRILDDDLNNGMEIYCDIFIFIFILFLVIIFNVYLISRGIGTADQCSC